MSATERTILQRILGRKKFAWAPTALTGGSFVFLQSYWLYETGYRDEEGVYSLAVDNFIGTDSSTKRTSTEYDSFMPGVYAKAVTNIYWTASIYCTTQIARATAEDLILSMPRELRGPLLLPRRWGYIGTIDFEIAAEFGEIVLSVTRSGYIDNPNCDAAARWLEKALVSRGYEIESFRTTLIAEYY